MAEEGRGRGACPCLTLLCTFIEYLLWTAWALCSEMGISGSCVGWEPDLSLDDHRLSA